METAQRRGRWGDGALAFASSSGWQCRGGRVDAGADLLLGRENAVEVPGATGAAGCTLLSGLLGLGFVALGLLVVYRRPGNPVGWIIAGVGVTAGASELVESYGVYSLSTEPGSLRVVR